MNPSEKKDSHAFSSFALGATVGVIAALVLGTDEGRQFLKKVLDSIPEKYKKIPDAFVSKEEIKSPPTPIINPLETPHHTTFDPEPPPPPPPAVNPFRPS